MISQRYYPAEPALPFSRIHYKTNLQRTPSESSRALLFYKTCIESRSNSWLHRETENPCENVWTGVHWVHWWRASSGSFCWRRTRSWSQWTHQSRDLLRPRQLREGRSRYSLHWPKPVWIDFQIINFFLHKQMNVVRRWGPEMENLWH